MKTLMTALKIAGLILVSLMCIADCAAGNIGTAGLTALLIGLPLANAVGNDIGKRLAKRHIARIHAEVWGQ